MSWIQARKRRALATVITSAIMMSAVAILGSAGVVWSQTSLNSQQVEMANSVDDYINKSKSFIYTSALPSFLIEYSLKKFESNREKQKIKLEKNIKQLSKGLIQIGYVITVAKALLFLACIQPMYLFPHLGIYQIGCDIDNKLLC